MEKIKFISLTLVLILVCIGCKESELEQPNKPDLIVTNLVVNWESENKKAKAEIGNIGMADAGEFMVYFNPEEDPISQNRRPQVTNKVPGLSSGDSIVLTADFAPEAHPDNYNLANVFKIVVIADPKNMVEESDEYNNEKEVAISH